MGVGFDLEVGQLRKLWQLITPLLGGGKNEENPPNPVLTRWGSREAGEARRETKKKETKRIFFVWRGLEML